MSKFNRGDTLIEVLFAFAILASIVGFAFTGALQAYKASISAQNQTQAFFIAQYQADGLRTYRDSITWKSVSLGLPSFLDGGGLGANPLPKMSDYIDTGEFCVKWESDPADPNFAKRWKVQTDLTGVCDNLAKQQAPNLQNPTIRVRLTPGIDIKQVVTTITVSWQAVNSDRIDSVVNTIILTEDK